MAVTEAAAVAVAVAAAQVVDVGSMGDEMRRTLPGARSTARQAPAWPPLAPKLDGEKPAGLPMQVHAQVSL